MSDYLAVLPLADVKTFLNLDTKETQSDSWLEREIVSQLQVIENYLDRTLIVQQFKDQLDGKGRTRLSPCQSPVHSVLSVEIGRYRDFRNSRHIGANEYTFDDEYIELHHDVFNYGHRNVQVSYIAGYAEIEIPFARRRFDFREAAGDDLLTVYLPTGKWKPTDLADTLQWALNDIGEFQRSVAFDWTHRHFTIATESDYLEIVSHVTNEFTSTTSATGLLGFHKTARSTDGAVIGDAVTIGIPEAIKSVALELIAMQYVKSAFNGNRYGLRSYRLDDYQVTYETGNENAMNQTSGMTPKLENTLKPYKRWSLF